MKKMRKTKRIVAIILMMLLTGTMLASPLQAGVGKAATDKMDYMGEYEGQELLRGKANVSLISTEKSRVVKYFYSDAFFAGEASSYDAHLASFAMNLCASSGNEIDSEKIFDDCGFEDASPNEVYQSGSGPDTIGDIIAHKTIQIDGKDQEVVVAVVKGLDYGLEWSNNFKIGTEGDAKGFSDSADKVAKEINDYVSKHEISADKTKYLITGYSRGAAVADIVAKQLTDSYADNVLGYCFATPNSVLTSNRTSEYKNIHNVINKNDLVTYVFLSELGFGHYGSSESLTSMATSEDVNAQLEKMGSKGKYDDSLDVYNLDITRLLTSKKGTGDPLNKGNIEEIDKKDLEKGDLVENGKIVGDLFDKILESDALVKSKGVSMSQEDFIEITSGVLNRDLITSRDRYAKEAIDGSVTTEQAIRSILEVFLSNPSGNLLISDMMDAFKGAKLDTYALISLVYPLLIGIDKTEYKSKHKEYYDKLWAFVEPAFKKNLTSDEFSIMQEVWPALVYNVSTLVSGIYMDKTLIAKKLDLFKFVGTWLKNGKNIISNHYTDTYLAFLRSADDFYRREDEDAQERPAPKKETVAGDAGGADNDGDAVSGPGAALTASAIGKGDGLLGIIFGIVVGALAGGSFMYAYSRRKTD